ncbi:MAG: hypothetical protein ABL999_00875 [Pyrinomonadaceae bacterium]
MWRLIDFRLFVDIANSTLGLIAGYLNMRRMDGIDQIADAPTHLVLFTASPLGAYFLN